MYFQRVSYLCYRDSCWYVSDDGLAEMTDTWPNSIVPFRPFIWARFKARCSVSPMGSQAFFCESRVILDEISHSFRIPFGS